MEDCTVWICDDEPQQAGFLQRLTADWAKRRAFKLHITQYHSAEELLFAYDADKRVDILLLDIELPGISGMELARRVRQSDRQLQIVFVSGYSDYLADGYEVEALHYLLKPVSAQKLDAVLDRALERLDARGRSLLVESDEGLCRLPLSEIRWLEVMGNYVTIHAGRDYTLRKPPKDLEPLLDESFFRTGRSFLVNLRFVKEVTRTQVTLTDASTVPLSRRRYDAIHHAIISYF
ncbi:MAG: response regulator transcription factor [Lachnospiraceae bacterium]|nr:LytTR family DNA-binding domain-containing protein [uncultured Acetatifactor sp.]MCI9574178.1 response regulator transcription factor [Lachnospiraceae bacterium]